MPAGRNVRPKRWSNVIDIYDDNDFSAIWGNYDKSSSRKLGVRWNGDPGEVGFPSQGKYSTWFVMPDWLERTILLALRNSVNNSPSHGKSKNISIALNECSNNGTR